MRLNKLIVLSILLFSGSNSYALEENNPIIDKTNWDRTEDLMPLLSNSLQGDQYSVQSGLLAFQNTDLDIPGNFPINVDVVRGRSVLYSGGASTREFGDWSLKVPQIVTRLAAYDNKVQAWGTNSSFSTPKECSGNLGHGGFMYHNGEIYTGVGSHTYWNADSLDIPNVANERLLAGTDNSRVTKNYFQVSCIARPDGGQGFVVTTTSGIQYTFNVPKVFSPNTLFYSLTDFVAVMRVSSITDRHGNSVNYAYEADELKSITSSDGRVVSFIWDDYLLNGKSARFIHKVTSSGDGEDRTVEYFYDNGILKKVLLPDNTSWSYDLHRIVKEPFRRNGDWDASYIGQCDIRESEQNSSVTLTVTDPYGNHGQYKLEPVYHGRTKFPVHIDQIVSGVGGGIGGSTITKIFKNVNCSVNYSLTEKTLTLATGEAYVWKYVYSQNSGGYATNSHNAQTGTAPYLYGTLPDNITDAVDYKTVKQINPDLSSEVSYINRDSTSYIEGKVVAIDYFSDADKKNKTEIFDYVPGEFVGRANIIFDNAKPLENEINLTKRKIILHSDAETTSYSVSYSDFNSYGAPQVVHEFNDDHSKYTKTDYVHDTVQWVLNLPAKTYVAGADKKYVLFKEITYNNNMLPHKELWFDQLLKTHSYHADGNLEQTTFAGTDRYHKFENYYRGKAQKITQPCGVANTCDLANGSTANTAVALLEVNPDGTTKSITDFNGNKTSYEYTAMGWPTLINYADIRWKDRSISYTTVSTAGDGVSGSAIPVGSLRQSITQGNYEKRTYLDGLLRPIFVSEFDSSDSTTTRYKSFSYDWRNNQTFESFPSDKASNSDGIKTEYDALGRMFRRTRTNHTSEEVWKYLANNKVAFTDAKNNTVTTTYLAYGSPATDLPTQIDAPEGSSTTVAYNLFDQVKYISQGDITENRFYDDYQRLCKSVRPETGITAYGYNQQRQVVWRAEGTNGSDNSCDADAVPEDHKMIIVYNNYGRISSENYPDNTPDRSYGYDANGNLTQLYSNGVNWDYLYNSLNSLEHETLSIDNNSYTVDWTYDNLGTISAVKYPSGKNIDFAPNALGQPTRVGSYMTSINYYPNGQLKGGIYGNGLAFSQTLDTQQRPEYQSVKRNSISVLNHHYQYDDNSNIDTISDLITPAKNISLTYDDLDRLETASGFWGVGSFDYDELGNIERKTLGSQNLIYAYNGSNQLSGISGSLSRAFVYDNRGNITNNGQRVLHYNLANQLISSGNNTYQYDGYNRRVKKVSSGKTQYSLYSAAGQLLVTEGDKGLTEYFYLGNKLIAKESEVPTSEDTPGYTGHLEDDDLQLTYMQQRYYDPVIGRFYSNDPVDMLGHMQKGNPTMGFNRYAYTNNNPYKYTDPDGRYLFPITSGTGGRSIVDTKPMTPNSYRGSGDVKSTLDTTATVANITAVALIPLLPESAAVVATAKLVGTAAGVASAALGENPKKEVAMEVISASVGGKVAGTGADIIKGAANLEKFSGADKAVDAASEVVGNAIGDAMKNNDKIKE